ncbi:MULTISPECIES: tetratricopeptide repeat protein [unclassified Campylobacter]|uniref:tetratricopeptide repeat protein n=1 Tax=unclassified Campylobacter TaxID=2593542 RepID=UPI001237B7B2|nr:MULTISPECIES: flagellar protein [unclassified Campylobacter]KAA6227265.1 flagellar protein [Campylobacter sp. LR286c]KAA6228270.1 flagellar protein [Campylobacter sp. LR196d]KAA6229270.1 flagellar protein [Campylobacter sp. LR291e]KAA6231076.1 flagellar protein [Campylobacter sp. LR264d]
MRILLLCLISLSWLCSFELILNTGRENNQAFAVLHAKNDQEFTCKSIIIDAKMHFECEIPGSLDNELKDKSFDNFDLKFIKEEQKIRLIIYPKIPARLFELSQNIYLDKELSLSTTHKSKGFTFLFSKDIIKAKEVDGLNFSIDFPHQSMPYVGALDLNSDPVVIPQSADINTFLRIKEEYDKGNYAQVATDSANAIIRYVNSIFMSEFILYKLRAQDKIYNNNIEMRDQQVLESMINDAKNWTRTYTSDRHFPEILHIMLKTYMSLAQRADVDYTMSILENEQSDSYFTELSRLEFADYIYNLGEKPKAMQIYEDIYYNTANLHLAAKAAMSLARDLLANNNTQGALTYINTIFRANPNYFGEDITRSLELARILYQQKLYDESAVIYESVFKKMPRIDENYEHTLKDLALALSHTSRGVDAKKYIDLYLNEFVDGAFLGEIHKANDEVFLSLKDNNASYLHQRYQALIKQYQTEDENIAKQALDEDMKLYYDEGNFNAILDYKDQIEQAGLNDSAKLLEEAAINALNNDLKDDECLKAVAVFDDFASYNIGQKINDKKKMFECLERTSKINEALKYADTNLNDDLIYYGLKKAYILYDNKDYKSSIKIGQDIASSRLLKSEEENFKAYYIQFVSLLKMNEYNEAIKILRILESYPMNFNMVEAYDSLLSFAKDNNMQTTILTYAPKAIDYQNLRGINLFSPTLEFLYLEALKESSQNELALEVLKDLLKLKLSPEDRARALYTQSLAYEALGNINGLNESLKQCMEVNATSNWQSLCIDKNQLLSQQN